MLLENNFIVSWDANSRLEPTTYTVRTKKDYISKNRREGIHSLIQDCFAPTYTNSYFSSSASKK